MPPTYEGDYTMPEHITQIAGSAFSACSSLTSIDIPNGVKHIGDWAFSGCSSLKKVAIPKGVTRIGKGLFRDCSALKSVAIPNSVTEMSSSAFCGCLALKKLTIPKSVMSIVYDIDEEVGFYGSFYETSLYANQSNWDKGVMYISNCLITAQMDLSGEYTINKRCRLIADYAFCYCEELTHVTIPEGVTSIGIYAFAGCSSLTSVTIPEGVTSIGRLAFYGCSKLKAIYIPRGTKERFAAMEGFGDYAHLLVERWDD
jgi:hypothetical protein